MCYFPNKRKRKVSLTAITLDLDQVLLKCWKYISHPLHPPSGSETELPLATESIWNIIATGKLSDTLLHVQILSSRLSDLHRSVCSPSECTRACHRNTHAHCQHTAGPFALGSFLSAPSCQAPTKDGALIRVPETDKEMHDREWLEEMRGVGVVTANDSGYKLWPLQQSNVHDEGDSETGYFRRGCKDNSALFACGAEEEAIIGKCDRRLYPLHQKTNCKICRNMDRNTARTK